MCSSAANWVPHNLEDTAQLKAFLHEPSINGLTAYILINFFFHFPKPIIIHRRHALSHKSQYGHGRIRAQRAFGDRFRLDRSVPRERQQYGKNGSG